MLKSYMLIKINAYLLIGRQKISLFKVYEMYSLLKTDVEFKLYVNQYYECSDPC